MISEEQRIERRSGLGGSDIAGIIPDPNSKTGFVSPFTTAAEVWASKIDPDFKGKEESEAMWWGNQDEDNVARRFSMLTGKRVVNHNFMIHDGCLLANLDRLIIPEGQKVAAHMGQIRTTELFEAKTSGSAWNPADVIEMLPNGYQVLDGSEGVPAHYITQVMHYLGRVPTAEKIYVAVKASVPTRGHGGMMFARTEFNVYVLFRDDEFIKAQDAFAREWWQKHVIGNVAPDPVCEEDCKIIWRRSVPKSHITLDSRVWKAWHDLKVATDMANDAERAIDAAKTTLKESMGDNESIIGPDGSTEFVTWKSGKDKTEIRTDWEGLARSLNPTEAEINAVAVTWESLAKAKGVTEEQIAKFTTKTVKPGSRSFRPKFTDKVLAYAATVDAASLPHPPSEPERIPADAGNPADKEG